MSVAYFTCVLLCFVFFYKYFWSSVYCNCNTISFILNYVRGSLKLSCFCLKLCNNNTDNDTEDKDLGNLTDDDIDDTPLSKRRRVEESLASILRAEPDINVSS